MSSFVSNTITLNVSNKVILCVTNGLKLAITPKTGFFSGSFSNPATSKPLAFKGAFLQKENGGGGFFTGSNQTGFVTVEPMP